jgi:DNA repair protein RecO (recombination protein O)
VERIVTEGIVLRTIACGDADRIVTLFTSDLGRISAFAAHARKSRRRFAGALDPFTAVRVALVQRRGETWRLDSAEVIDSVPEIRGDLALIARAGYAVELVRELCRDQEPHVDLYRSLSGFLVQLARSPSSPTDLLRFEVQALGEVGLSPRLTACAVCETPTSAGDGFDPAQGGIVCRRCATRPLRPLHGGARLLAELQSAPPPDARSQTPENAADAPARAEARQALEEFLDYHVGVRLRSARFMRDVGVE